jgi:ELWxxDGT repeat protein
VHGFELWRSDGTPAGSALVKNVTPEVSNGIPSDRSLMATNVNGSLFFVANDGVHGAELWASDGTAQSTHMVKDIFSTNFPDDIPESLTSMKGALYFLVGAGIWKSNGTEVGTVIVKEPALIQHYFTGLTKVNGMLFFASDDKLWRSDGTTAGTILLRSFTPDICYRCDYEPAIDTFWNVNGRLFFSADDGSSYRLWTSDGTREGTVATSGIVPDGELPWLEVANGTWFFPAADDAHGAELWTSAGTPGSVRLVKDIAPGRLDANVSPLASVGQTLYLIADDRVHGAELWKSDGTAAGTQLVKDITPGADGSQIVGATAAGNLLFFVTQDTSHGRELWRSDGTAAGTQLVRDINPGLDNAFGSKPILTPLDDLVIFAADDGVHGTELWTSDGSAAGTTMAADIAPGSGSSDPGGFTSAGRYLFFSANDGTHGNELWALPLRSYPFRRTSVGLGALIQAEDFDQGGEHLAYHDRDPLNRDGAYRPDEGVDLQTDTGSSGGVHLAWAQAGEWLNYTVDVAQTQTYTLTVRVAAQGAAGVFHIAVDGVDRTGPLHIPDTGGWYDWRTIERSGLTLAAGRHTLRLVLDADGATSGVGNIDWISLLAPAKERVFLPEVH